VNIHHYSDTHTHQIDAVASRSSQNIAFGAKKNPIVDLGNFKGRLSEISFVVFPSVDASAQLLMNSYYFQGI